VGQWQPPPRTRESPPNYYDKRNQFARGGILGATLQPGMGPGGFNMGYGAPTYIPTGGGRPVYGAQPPPGRSYKAQGLNIGSQGFGLRQYSGGKPYTTKTKKRVYKPYQRMRPVTGKAGRRTMRGAAKAELMRMLGSLPSALKSVNPWEIDNWVKSMEEGVGSIEEAIGALQDLIETGVPEESYGEVSQAIGELLAAVEEDEAADEAGAYDEEDEAEEYEAGGYDQGYDEGYDEGYEGDVQYEPEYAYAGDDGGEYKAIGPGDDFEDAAAALAGRAYEMLENAPAIKSVGYEAPYINTHAPHGDRLAHLKAFDQFLHLGEKRMEPRLFWHLEACTKAAMQEDTDSEGGYLVPDEFSMDLIKALYNKSWLRTTQHRKFTMKHKTLEVPTVVESAAATRLAEEGSYTQQEPTTGVVTFTANKVQKMSKVSRELVADSRFPLWEQVLKPDYEQSFAEEENAGFTTGVGTTIYPQGVLTGSTLGVTAASPTVFTADEVKALYNALNHKYRGLPSVAWMMADATMGLIRLLKDGQGRYLINGDISKGEPETLLGKPVIINNGMEAATTGLRPILFGAFNYFGIADRQDMRIQRLEELYAVNGQIGFLADARNDSRVLLAAAFMHLLMA